MTAAIVLLCVLPLAASLSSTDKCSGTYYRPAGDFEHVSYLKFYYDSVQGSCKFFVYKECHSNVTNGYGNPHNKFDRLRDCQDTCFPVRDNLSTSCSITTSKTSSLHTATEPVSLSTSSPLMMSPSPVMIISSSSNVSGLSPIGFMPTSTLMLNPTQSLTVSVGRASTDDGGLSFVGSSTDIGPQFSISPSSTFSASSPSLSNSLSFLHTSSYSSALHSSTPSLISSTSSPSSYELFLVISGIILFVMVTFIISQYLYFAVYFCLAARRKRYSNTSLQFRMSPISAVETGRQPVNI
uniref:BPTI/Kunitz inhibitor domain-containing protein n=1 Tax=Amphimedon queenslandica TaxID=400682 RepID=A0A1X7TPI3_AMPQE